MYNLDEGMKDILTKILVDSVSEASNVRLTELVFK